MLSPPTCAWKRKVAAEPTFRERLEAILDEVLRRARSLLRTGGNLVVVVFDGPADPLARAVDAMIPVRSGGAALGVDEVMSRLRNADFGDAREVEQTWQAPLRRIVTGIEVAPSNQ